jgi:hypothetical protein
MINDPHDLFLAVSIHPLLTFTDIRLVVLSFLYVFIFYDALPILSPAQTPFPARGEREKGRRGGEGGRSRACCTLYVYISREVYQINRRPKLLVKKKR